MTVPEGVTTNKEVWIRHGCSDDSLISTILKSDWKYIWKNLPHSQERQEAGKSETKHVARSTNKLKNIISWLHGCHWILFPALM